jgi:hypothetical protein
MHKKAASSGAAFLNLCALFSVFSIQALDMRTSPCQPCLRSNDPAIDHLILVERVGGTHPVVTVRNDDVAVALIPHQQNR